MAIFKQSILTMVCLLFLSLMPIFPAVRAAQTTTTIYQVSTPTRGVAGSETPLSVNVTVYYNNTVAGYHLVVGILGTDQFLVPGVAVSSTDPCVNTLAATAVCEMIVTKPSGVEQVRFQIGGIFGARVQEGNWNLNATSLLKNSQGQLIASSVSSKSFMIDLVPIALNIEVPSGAVVSVDGVQQPPGSLSIGVTFGQHNITVPQLLNVSSSTRLRFDHWSDGSSSTFRSILITNSTTLQAYYVNQNLLTLIGAQGNVTVFTWYDSDDNATFSTSQYAPATGPLGILGARLTFQGWYENGQLLTDSPNGTISMDRPHTLTAIWQVDYVVPAAVACGVILAGLLMFLLLQRRKRTSGGRGRAKRRTKRA